MLPKKNATRFVHQCGVVVRDNIPISTPLWYKPANPEGVTYVSEQAKNDLWDKLIAHFTLPVLDSIEETNKMTALVKHFALKKMAEQFRNYKNKLYRDYVKDKKAPDFTGTLERQRAHWDAFLEYKDSELAKERSAKNKENAAKKKYHHNMGPGGYRTAEPKWDQAEAAMRDKGVTPATEAWPRRVRNWTLGHGAKYDTETGGIQVDEKKTISVAKKAIVQAIDDVQKGKFIPDRENDELTLALGNPEKSGRTRGLGADTPWKLGFPEDVESYRSRERAKKRKEKEEEDRLNKLEREHEEIIAIVRDQQKQIDEFRESGSTLRLQQNSQGGAPSQRKSSVASTGVGADEAPMDRYPVDDIREKTSCELHVGVSNLSLKAADGYALTCESTARWHCNPIPDGYGRVGVDQLVPGYESLELDIPGAEDERTLGEAGGGIILWRKKYFVFPGSAPRRPSPSRSPPPRQRTPSPSPPPTRQPTPPPNPPPAHQQGLKRKNMATPATSTTQRKTPNQSRIPKAPKPLPKRAYDMTVEENAAEVAAQVQAHFAPKMPEPKQIFDEKTKKWAKELIEQPAQYKMNLRSDYDREILKQNFKSENKKRSAKSGKQVPQLGELKNQPLPPLIVISDMDKQFRADMDKDFQLLDPRAINAARQLGITVAQAKENADAMGMSLGQLFGYEEVPMGEIARKYVKGQPLVSREEETQLSTHMRNLHEWYMMETSKKHSKEWFSADVREEHHFKAYLIHIQMNELFQLYNQRDLDKSILGCYCL